MDTEKSCTDNDSVENIDISSMLLLELVECLQAFQESCFCGGRFPLPDGYDAEQHSQRDVSEFLSSLLHHMDKCVSRSLVAATGIERSQIACLNPLEGQLIHRIYPMERGDSNLTSVEIIERTERFFYVSLNVIGFATMIESLEDFTKEDALQFRWSNSDELQSSGKTTRFNRLPKILSFFLKRFRFDIEKMKKVKVHDRFEFPNTLDMAPYLSGKPAGPVMYCLSGVVVHVGRSANRGHFYSLIARRPDLGSNEKDGDGDQWVKFDDDNVTSFDKQRWELDTFGGSHDVDENAYNEDDDEEEGGEEETEEGDSTRLREDESCLGDSSPSVLVNGWCNSRDSCIIDREDQTIGGDGDDDALSLRGDSAVCWNNDGEEETLYPRFKLYCLMLILSDHTL
eukprot:gene28965-38003_t